MGVKTFFANGLRFIRRHSTKFLSGMAIFGLGTSVTFAIKDTPAAQLAVDRLRDEMPEGQEPTKMEIFKAALPAYGRTIASTAITAGCIVGAEVINDREKALLTAACAASEAALTKWKQKTLETVGETKTTDIYEKLAREEVENNPVTQTNVIATGYGDSLIMDSWFGNYFTSDINKVRQAVNEVNSQIISDVGSLWASMNDFYYYLGLDPVEGGKYIGWNCDHKLEVQFTSIIAKDGRPCLVIGYVNEPRSYNNRDPLAI